MKLSELELEPIKPLPKPLSGSGMVLVQSEEGTVEYMWLTEDGRLVPAEDW